MAMAASAVRSLRKCGSAWCNGAAPVADALEDGGDAVGRCGGGRGVDSVAPELEDDAADDEDAGEDIEEDKEDDESCDVDDAAAALL